MSIEFSSTDPSTPVYHKPAEATTNCNDLLVMVPGNPGLVKYYIPYLNLIQKSIPRFEVYCIGYAGYFDKSSKHSTTSAKVYNVDEQIHHMHQVLKQIILNHWKKDQDRPPRLFFLSHSLGAFITQRIIIKLFEDNELASTKFKVQFNGMITPTIYDIAGSESGTSFTKMMNWKIPIVGTALVLSSILSFVPLWVQRKILTNHFQAPHKNDVLADTGPGENYGLENLVEATIELVNSGQAINQCLSMAKDEMKVIDNLDAINDWIFLDQQKQTEETEEIGGQKRKKERNCKEINNTEAVFSEMRNRGSNTKIGFKNWVFFAQNDHWVSNITRNYLLGRYQNEQRVGVNGGDNSEQTECEAETAVQAKVKIDENNKKDNYAKLGNLFEVCENIKRPIKHAFCINQSQEFAEITVDRIKKLCPDILEYY
ncbi:hypothetical protein LELG_00256 [Lodderomyces elongisporus NRRL YB-4239]|uniref:DUF676 domain-containing protein n=1 Tax=Lodderomyces elongisporus (strain ATCC 11503 / CBS 2605 / JCM 1781 / NBRC 1676 / NRRL YB-4239) TaxID=379508 RepID=A5DSC0_LODEL|nr:hypothetical protein LELG_00256 [Lodderomyces elongisporus NRRL YB-4239]